MRPQQEMKQGLVALLPRLRRFARGLTRNDSDADDLLQTACLRALDKADQWDRTQPLDRWVFRLTRNLWISEIRKRQVRMGQGQIDAEDAPELLSAETGEQAALARDVQREIDALPEELAALLMVVSVEGYSYDEAAELFEIPKGTVMSRLYRARKLLADRLSVSEGAGT